MGIEEKITIRYNVTVEYDGIPVMDSQLAELIRLVEREGSILSAARLLGIPYSRAWEMIARAERILGEQLIVARRGGRGGGGARITPIARKLLEVYDNAKRRLQALVGPSNKTKFVAMGEPDIIVAYSHDPLVELVLGAVREREYEVEGLCVGSGKALAILSLEEADIACIHLYDPDKNEYNKPFIEKYWLKNRVKPVGGYWRELVFALRPGLNIDTVDKVLELLVKGKLRLANRNTGSGTRVYLDYLLERKARELGINELNIPGYSREHPTHLDAARSIALGKADVALVLRYAAELYGLKTIHATWEQYECYALVKSLEKKAVKIFLEYMDKKKLVRLARNIRGYRFT